MSKRRVSYYYDSECTRTKELLNAEPMPTDDVGLFSYGHGHAMKPHRMRMTHDLVASYGMLDKMEVLRPRRASASKMTAFHTDEYIHFLSRVTPETEAEMTLRGTRCTSLYFVLLLFTS